MIDRHREDSLIGALLGEPPHDPRLPAYLGSDRLLIALSTGQPFIVETNGLDLGIALVRYGKWEHWITPHLLRFVLRHGDPVIVDVGANVGYFSAVLAPHAPSRRLWAFEPNERLHRILRQNLQINGIPQECAHRFALGAEPSELKLRHKPGESGGGHLLLTDPFEDQEYQTVQVKTLDTVLPSGTQVDLLKVDVEAFEPHVLAGARQTILQSPDMMMCVEVTPDHWRYHGYEPKEVLQSLADEGFSFRLALHDDLVPFHTVSDLVHRVEHLDYTTCVLGTRNWSMFDGY